MCIAKPAVKALAVLLAAMFLPSLATAGESSGQPHMMYFYNPSCRLCTKTNEVVNAVEAKYGDRMTHQRFNIADSESGTDNVLYMFELMDELEVPEEGNVTLVIFLGLLEEEDGEYFFVPKRALLEEKISETLESAVADFLATDGKGGKVLGLDRPAHFFFAYCTRLDAGS